MRKLSLSPEALHAVPGQDDGPRYAAFPVQQLVRSHVHAFQVAFAHEAIARLGDSAEDVVYKPSYKGLRIFGLTEMALPVPGEGDRQVVRRAGQSRTATGTLSVGPVVQEPVMSLMVRAPRRFIGAVRSDLLRRGAEIVKTDLHPTEFVAWAQASQAELLGYAARLDALTEGRGEVCMWLSQYAPLSHGSGPEGGVTDTSIGTAKAYVTSRRDVSRRDVDEIVQAHWR